MPNRRLNEPPEPGRTLARPPALGGGDVHVWLIDLDRLSPFEDELGSVLSADENRRAGRFHRERDRAYHVAGRAALRHLLGRYLGCAPGAVPIATGPHGKPHVRGKPGLHFNLSHSANLALLAVTRVAPVGVDLERIDPIPELEAIAARYFTDRESREIAEAPAADRARLFYHCWTRKEAYLKAVGGGLTIPLRSVDLSVSGPPRLLAIHGDGEAALQWSMRHLRPARGFVGAVAAHAPRLRVRRLRWTGPEVTAGSPCGA